MRVVRHTDPQQFLRSTLPFLLQHEAVHNVLIGVISRLAMTGEMARDVYIAHVACETGEVVGAAMCTPPLGVVLSNVTKPHAIALLADDVTKMYDTLPTVLGRAADARAFAQCWQDRVGQAFSLKMAQGIFELTEVTPVTAVDGAYRVPTADHAELMIDWAIAMEREALGNDRSREEAAHLVTQKLSADDPLNAFRLWVVEDEPVAMAASTRPTPNGVTINFVYTPPEHRRRGYASAVVAALSQEMLDQGRAFCSLYTDLGNPTTNKIYQAIGYRQIGESHLYEFGDAR